MATLTSTLPALRGLYLDWPKDMVPDGGMSDGSNVEVSGGALQRVPGWIRFASITPNDPVMMVADLVTSDGSRTLLACSTRRLYAYNPSTLAFQDLTGGSNLLTGDVTNPISWGTLNDLLILTNGVDPPKKTNGTTWGDLVGAPSSALGLDIYEGHVICWNVNGVGYRVQWSDLNAAEEWAAGEAGFLDVRESNLLPIVAGKGIRRQFLLYKEGLGGVYAATYVGPPLVMSVETIIPRFGVIGPHGVAAYRDMHFILASDEQIYVLAPGSTPEPIGEPIRKRLFSRLNWDKKFASWVAVNPTRTQVMFVVPEGQSEVCNKAYLYDITTGAWGERDLAMHCGGIVRDPRVVTIDSLVGTIDELSGSIDSLSGATQDIFLIGGEGQTYHYGASPQADGVAIPAWAVGKWLTNPGKMSRVLGVEVDVRGRAMSVDIGILDAMEGTPMWVPLGNITRGRVDANLSGRYIAPRFVWPTG